MLDRTRPRTFLLFMAGDNDLSDAGLRDVEELCQEGASQEIYVALEIDTQGEHSGSIRYEITEPDFEGRAHRTVIDRVAERDSGHPRTLREFLTWGLRRYPAEETILVAGGHGEGFRGKRRSIALDELGSSLDMNEFSFVLKESGIGEDHKLAVLGFDACLMCMLEIAHHFEPYTRILVGSQQTEPGDGWPYHEVLKSMKSADRDIAEVAIEITQAYADHYIEQAITNVTQSAILLERTPAAMAALSELGETLAQNLGDLWEGLQEVRSEVQTFHEPEYIDAVDFARRLQGLDHPEVTRAARTFESLVAACILGSTADGDNVRDAHGLSIWFPEARFAYLTKRAQYRRLSGIADRYPGWSRFLHERFSGKRRHRYLDPIEKSRSAT